MKAHGVRERDAIRIVHRSLRFLGNASSSRAHRAALCSVVALGSNLLALSLVHGETPWSGPLTVQWQHDAGRAVTVPVQLVGEVVFVATTDRRLAAFDLETGERRWQRRFKESVSSAPAFLLVAGHWSLVFVHHGPERGGELRGLDADTGDDVWRLPAPIRVVHLAALEDRLWVLDVEGNLVARTPANGKELWRHDRMLGWDPPPFAVSGDTLFVVGRTDSLHALSGRDGTRYWSTSLPGRYVASPERRGDELIVLEAGGAMTRLEAATGRILAQERRASQQLSRPVWHSDHVVTASTSGIVESRDAAGAGWSLETGFAFAAPPVAAGPLVLAASTRGDLIAVRAERGEIAWSLDLKTRLNVAPLFTERYLILATGGGDILVYRHGT